MDDWGIKKGSVTHMLSYGAIHIDRVFQEVHADSIIRLLFIDSLSNPAPSTRAIRYNLERKILN